MPGGDHKGSRLRHQVRATNCILANNEDGRNQQEVLQDKLGAKDRLCVRINLAMTASMSSSAALMPSKAASSLFL